MEIKVPLLQNPTGLGDVIAAATKAVGIKPCPPCEERRRKLNQALRLAPRWTSYPNVPEGWTAKEIHETPEKIVALYERQGTWIVWEVFSGRYQNSYAFGCDSCSSPQAEQAARIKAEDLWQQTSSR